MESLLFCTSHLHRTHRSSTFKHIPPFERLQAYYTMHFPRIASDAAQNCEALAHSHRSHDSHRSHRSLAFEFMAGAAGCLSGALSGLAPKELQPVAEGFRGRQAGPQRITGRHGTKTRNSRNSEA